MKKYFLKGKEILTKKLQQYDFETKNIDYVAQQIPNKLKKSLKILENEDIDLEQHQLYQTYFKNYPTHHLSKFLLQKYLTNLKNNNKQQQNYQLPNDNLSCFIPKFDQQFQQQALLFQQIIQQYDQGYTKVQEAIICICVIHFHHKRGTQIQYRYPTNSTVQSIQDHIVHHAMPDSSHNKNQDYNFFNFETVLNHKKKMLFGVSYFKQIKVTQEMRIKNPQLTRSYIQKAIAVISTLPLFGYLKLRLSVTTKIFFNNFINFQVIDAAYNDINKHLLQTWPKISINQLYIGSDLKVILNLFGAKQFYQIWKAVLYKKRVVVFAHSSSSASSFILSLLTLFPGMSTFGMYSKPISKYMQSLRQYALPLKLFNSNDFLCMSFHIQDFHLLSRFQKSSKGNFLLGTTNRLLKQANDYGVDMLINLQNCTIERKKYQWQGKSKKQKTFIIELENIVDKEKKITYSGSEDCIRNHFHSFLKDNLIQLIQAIQQYKNFQKQCQDYTKIHQNDKKSTTGSYHTVPQELQTDITIVNNDFPPIVPDKVLNMPFAQLLLKKSFNYFLYFHNENLPKIRDQKIFPYLWIDNYTYLFKFNPEKFICYDCNQNKLIFGKGNPQNYEGKQIKFMTDLTTLQAKSIYIGLVENNKYSKNGFFFDRIELYEGQFNAGMKSGYGKLTNKVHKYIGHFQNNLYSGQGQLLTGSDIYVGQFKEGLRHGCGKNQGQLTYDGEWTNDKPEGHGTLKLQDQQIVASFIKGVVDDKEQITIRYDNGVMYKGYSLNLLPEGKGFMLNEDGKLIKGIFKDGRILHEETITQIKQNQEQKLEIQQLQDQQTKGKGEVNLKFQQMQQQAIKNQSSQVQNKSKFTSQTSIKDKNQPNINLDKQQQIKQNEKQVKIQQTSNS